jgi:hypothetical protein
MCLKNILVCIFINVRARAVKYEYSIGSSFRILLIMCVYIGCQIGVNFFEIYFKMCYGSGKTTWV